MDRRQVKSVTVTYKNGDVVTFEEEGMIHILGANYKKGDTKPEHGFTTHEIRWNKDEPFYKPLI